MPPGITLQQLAQHVAQLEQLATVGTQALSQRADAVVKKQFMKVISSGSYGNQNGPFIPPGDPAKVNDNFWPYFFTPGRTDVPAGSQTPSSFSVTQEADFIITSFVKTVFLNLGGGAFQYLDPDFSSGVGKASGLSFFLQDQSSTRQFMDVPIELDHVGNPKYPTYLPRPIWIARSGRLNVTLTNTDPTNNYTVFLVFKGYRARLDDILAAQG